MMKKATIWSPLYATCVIWTVEVTGVSFSDSAPVPKFLNPGPSIFQIWESDSCSESGYNHQSNLNLPIFLLKKWQHRLLLLPKLKNDSGPFFPKFLTPVQIRVWRKNAESAEILTQKTQKSGVKRNFWPLRNFWFVIVFFASQNKGIKFGNFFFDVCCVN